VKKRRATRAADSDPDPDPHPDPDPDPDPHPDPDPDPDPHPDPDPDPEVACDRSPGNWAAALHCRRFPSAVRYPRRVRPRAFLCFFTLVAACGDGGGQLVDLRDISLHVNVRLAEDGESALVDVGLWDPSPDVIDDFDRCPTMGGDLGGTLNGLEMEVIAYGGYENEGDLSGDPDRCGVPHLEITLVDPLPERMEIVIEDDSLRLAASFGDFFAKRELILIDPADAVLRPEQLVELEWRPASDVFREPFDGLFIDTEPPDDAFERYYPVSVQEDRIFIELPAFEQAGTAEIGVNEGGFVTPFSPEADQCDGPDECLAFIQSATAAVLTPEPVPVELSP
jgi:hypothetical protein